MRKSPLILFGIALALTGVAYAQSLAPQQPIVSQAPSGAPQANNIQPAATAPSVPTAVATSGSSVGSLSYAFTGLHTGDTLVALQNGSGLTVSTSSPFPWNQIDTNNANSTQDFLVVHNVQTAEGGVSSGNQVSYQLNGGTIFAGIMLRITNTPACANILDKESSNTAAAAATWNGPTVTTTAANDLCVAIAEHGGSNGTITATGPAGLTLIQNPGSLVAYRFTKATAGITTALAYTDSGGAGSKGSNSYLACFMPCGN